MMKLNHKEVERLDATSTILEAPVDAIQLCLRAW